MKQKSILRGSGTHSAVAIIFATLLTLLSCATIDPETLKSELNAQPTTTSASAKDYAGDFRFGFRGEIEAQDKALPYTLNAGLSSVTPTRLGFRGLLDLRELQALAPDLLSGPMVEGCTLNVEANLEYTEAKGDLIALFGTVDVEVYRCRGEESDRASARGVRLIATTIGIAAAARANVSEQCVYFGLAEVVLQPTGFVGGLVNLFGLTERVEQIVVTKANEFFEENAICPKMPPELSSLEPILEAGGTREIGNGGIGVALNGSIDTSAATMMELLALMQSRDIVGGEE